MGREMSNVRAHVHLPLRRLALCIDCDECFELGLPACPACSSETWTPLARFVEGRAYSSAHPLLAVSAA
jgi:hypothetical protein